MLVQSLVTHDAFASILKRVNSEQIEEIARRVEAGEQVSPRELRAVCDMALELLQAAPSLELVRIAMLLVSSRGALPLKSSQAEALGAAVLKAAQASLLESAYGALQETRAALAHGRNWLEGLERIPRGSAVGAQLPALSRSMTKTMQRCLTGTAAALNFGMAVQPEPLDPAEPGYKEVPAFDQVAPRPCANELERAHEALRIGRLGVLKVARFTHALSLFAATQVWDEALAQQAARNALDAAAHLAALAQLSSAQGPLP